MRKFWHRCIAAALFGALSFAIPAPLSADDNTKETDRVENAGKVVKEIMNIPDNIPQSLIDKADCVIILPSVLKAAFIVGASYGRGVMTCRSGANFRGPWSAPSMMALEGGSFGFQIGGQATDFVLLIMNEGGASAILSSKVKLGADASAAAGPVGRNGSRGHGRDDAGASADVFAFARIVRGRVTRRLDAAPR